MDGPDVSNKEPFVPVPPPPTGAETASLSSALNELHDHAAGKGMTIGDAVDVLHDRGIAMVMVVITLPFLLPIPLVGLSTPIGGTLALFGLCLALQRPAWVPKFIARRELSASFLEKLLRFGMRWAKRFEYFMKPRLHFMTWRGADSLIGIAITISALFLALPLPIPFSNSVPAISILLLLLGLIERDGVFVLLGQVISGILLTLIVYCLYLIGVYGFGEAWQMLENWLDRGPTTTPA